MSRITNPMNDIKWDWFTSLNIDEIDVTNDVTSSIKNISDLVNGFSASDTEDSRTVSQLGVLLENISGVSGGVMILQENWYNSWLSLSTPNYNSFSLNAIIQIVKTKSTSNLSTLLTQLNYIMKFVLIRHFATPIPTSYLKNSAPIGTKPRLVDNSSIYYTEMTGQLHSFFINSQEGVYGIGNDTIQLMCSNFSRSTISKYVPIKKWCGCFAPEDPLTISAKKLFPESSSYNVSCDPLCIYFDAIKAVYAPGSDAPGTNVKCNATLCIMSKFDLQTADSNGSINLSQNCPCSTGAASGPCICVIDSSVEDLLNKTTAPNGVSMADPVTFNQHCPGAECFVQDQKGNLKQVACNKEAPNGTSNITKNTENIGTVVAPNIWYLFLSILLVGITLLQCARYIGHEPKYEVKGLLKPKIKIQKNTKSSDLGFLKR